MNSNIDIAKRIASSLDCTLSKDVLKIFAEILIPEKYKKGERILDEGQVCDSLYFIDKGMTRQFYFKYDKDLTEHIGYEDSIVVCLESYFNEEPTKLMIETLEPTIAWKIKKHDIVHLASINSEMGTLYRRIFEKSLITSQQKADTLSQVSTAINSLKVQFNMKDKADKKDNPFSTSASTEGSANESDFMNFVSSYNTEVISENANSSINSTFLTVVSKANFSEEGEEKQEEKIEVEIKEQQEVDIMATEEAKIEYKVEEDGKTSEEAEKEVKEEKGETEEIERQEKEDLKNSIMTTDAEKAELEKEEEETK